MKQTPVTEALYDYAEKITLREQPALKQLRESTAHLQLAEMQTSPLQAQFLQFLAKTIEARRILEIGTYTGYTSLALALALPEEGELITCDINPEWTQYALPYWKAAGKDHTITLKLQPALKTLEELTGLFDLIYIDADKTNYNAYYEKSLALLAPKGVIAIDNIFWSGKVTTPSTEPQTRDIQKLNAHIQQDKRVDIATLPIGDGLFLIRHHS